VSSLAEETAGEMEKTATAFDAEALPDAGFSQIP